MSRRCQGPVLHGVPLPMHCPNWALPDKAFDSHCDSTFVVSASHIQYLAKLKSQDELHFMETAACGHHSSLHLFLYSQAVRLYTQITAGWMDHAALAQANGALNTVHEIATLLDTGLDKDEVAILIALVENGAC